MAAVEEPTSVDASIPELNLLLEWPHEGSRPYWTGVIAASLAVHGLVLLLAVNLPSFAARNEPEQQVVEHRIPLYIPRDVLTQKAPNRQKVSKEIDLADLLASRQTQARAAAPGPSVKHFELPKKALAQKPNRTAPQILSEAPQVAMNQPQGPPPPGVANGISAPPPPAPAEQPFQNVGAAAPPNANPKLAPPRIGSSKRLVVTDDNSSEPTSGAPGAIAQPGTLRAAVELPSDAQNADFKEYLTRILAIVRPKYDRLQKGTLPGRTVLEFFIKHDGTIANVDTTDPSGSEALNIAARASLFESNPLPRLPADYKGSQVRVALTFRYNPAQ